MLRQFFRAVELSVRKSKHQNQQDQVEQSLMKRHYLKLNEVRTETKALILKLAERNTNDLLFPHPFGFDMNAMQWVHFIDIHEMTHVNQIRRIREANI